jgi:hypothetical protein
VVLSYKALPIGYTTTKPSRLIVACVDPLAVPVEELAFAAGSRIERWAIPELLFEECMEKYFGVPRKPTRYLAIDSAVSDSPGPVTLAAGARIGPVRGAAQAATPAKRSARPPAKKKSKRPPLGLTLPPPPSLARPAPAMLEVPGSGEAAVVPQPSVTRDARAPSASSAPATLSLSAAPPEDRPVTAPPDVLRPVLDRAQASALLESAASRDEIGGVLEDWLRSTFGCGLVFIVKGDMAIGWRGFFPDADDLVEALAVPLNKPTMLSLAFQARAPFRGPPPPEGGKVQERLWRLLRCAAPAEVIVCPIVLGKRVVNLVYAHMDDGSALPDGAVDDATALSLDAAAAYARLIDRDRKKH